MSETNEDWMEEMLVLTHECLPPQDAKGPRALPTVTLKPTPAADLWDTFSDDGNGWAALRADIKAVALHDGTERTTFVDGLRYHVRRATRAERLGQEDREHEDEGEGRSSSDAYDEENLREQLDEALALLREAFDYEAEAFDNDEDVNGGDLVQFFADWRQKARAFSVKHGRG